MILGEVIGISFLLLISLIVAVKVLIEEIKEDIEDRKLEQRRRWNRYGENDY